MNYSFITFILININLQECRKKSGQHILFHFWLSIHAENTTKLWVSSRCLWADSWLYWQRIWRLPLLLLHYRFSMLEHGRQTAVPSPNLPTSIVQRKRLQNFEKAIEAQIESRQNFAFAKPRATCWTGQPNQFLHTINIMIIIYCFLHLNTVHIIKKKLRYPPN